MTTGPVQMQFPRTGYFNIQISNISKQSDHKRIILT